jgi:hypothetical protein
LGVENVPRYSLAKKKHLYKWHYTKRLVAFWSKHNPQAWHNIYQLLCSSRPHQGRSERTRTASHVT